MSIALLFDPLLLLLDDPALLDALLAGEDPDLAAAVPGAPSPQPPASFPDALLPGEGPDLAAAVPGATSPQPPASVLPEDPVTTIEELEALLADLEAAARDALTDAFGVDPDPMGDIDAFITAFAGLEPSPEGEAPAAVSGEGSSDSFAAETVREDWALG
ncbi:hypothetical protein [Roseomonas fluvialis]|uniref:Uncharacterized protein n=1 Tax=Roseomonas fluvialis TaxID=1750527 RepID=A0ABN6P8E2_9PROT|nr:hypothetical protein [Roseomonas fluvialis]BDG74850.1 hypothetical protein Rmf_47790 [Roseomonas fluvialis]